MRQQAHTLSESVLTASQNTLRTNLAVEDIIEERLLDNAGIIRSLYERGVVTDKYLVRYAEDHDLYRINIFSRSGKKLYSSHIPIHTNLEERESPKELLGPIFEGKADTLRLGLKAARFEDGFRYAVALAGPNRSAIVVNLNADQLLEFRKKIGLGSLLRRLIRNSGIRYAALQDTAGILAASGNVQELERINGSPFLEEALNDSLFLARITTFNSISVFEAVTPFYFEGESIGLFRLGLSLQPMNAINRRIYRRIIFISVVLLIVGFILFTFLSVRQNLDMLSRQYQTVETYSQSIIQNVKDAIIVFEEPGGIRIFNQSAEKLFGVKSDPVLGKSLAETLGKGTCEQVLAPGFVMQEISCRLGNETYYLLVSKNQYHNPDGQVTTILVIRDLTNQKMLENQVQRRERLTALGELASGVAHEIRNPLNAIGTVIQQLDRDFEPQNGSEEYHQLSGLVYHEVKRINKTVENFLRFARPEPIRSEEFNLADFVEELKSQYQSLLNEKKISLLIKMEWTGEVEWDRPKMKQVFVNLFQNAMDAMPHGGELSCWVSSVQAKELIGERVNRRTGETRSIGSKSKDSIADSPIHPLSVSDEEHIQISVKDTGGGISPEIQKKIFNLYFTTKADGTGIGLSIVQRIVDQHGGVISLESEPGKGTRFILVMPVRIPRAGA